jgi:hypothetical protein
VWEVYSSSTILNEADSHCKLGGKFRLVLFSIFTALLQLCKNVGANPPTGWFRNFDARIREQRGNIKSSLPLLAVLLHSSRACECLKFQIKVLCHDRGREFESRRPRHFFPKELH